jgi:subtilase family serine protease
MIRKASVLCFSAVLALVVGFSTPLCLAADPGFAAVGGQVRPTTDTDLGEFTNAHMSIEIVLAPRNAPELSGLLTDLYDANSPNYQHWLAQGEFASRFAPDAAELDAVAGYLRESGLDVESTSSPFLLRAGGPSSVIESAFHTALRSYRNPQGIGYFANASEIQLPESLASGVLAVVGLSDTVRPHTHIVRQASHSSGPSAPGCEAPYATIAELYNFLINNVPFPAVYGGGPGCYGLTPDQTNSLYGAPDLGSSATKGAGVTLAVFELSAYQRSDINTWTNYFYGSKYKAPLEDVIVDGGPLAPICPTDDECPPSFEGYAGDIEVDADIETQLAIAPDMQRLLVYNAPNDETGQTELDEYRKIADDDIADVISSSWGECENDAGAALVQAENLVFEQMALQGQSIFGSSGDSGFVDCITTDGTTIASVDDPSTQPWVTSVGGTSFETFNPDSNPNPSYPTGVETVWNFYNLCNSKANEYGLSGFGWCIGGGAGGGGNSQFWGRPIYQNGPGITNPYTAYANGTTNCAFARRGTPCREVPDISADADPLTGYAEYCTGSAATPNSVCATITGQDPAGWFEIGGTSLSSPLWSGIIADQDSYFRSRLGNANPLLYELYDLDAPGFFNDITGIHQLENNNGLFPTTPGYDQATGIGTPRMGAIITLTPQR